MTQNKARIEYIDALRGFVMLLVVLGHVPMYCYHQVGDISFSLIFTFFHLPLMFYISGCFCKIISGMPKKSIIENSAILTQIEL